MIKSRKFISVLLALTMVFGVFAITANAWTGDGTQELKFDVSADKTTVNPGDTVTVTCNLHVTEGGTWANTFGGFAIAWMYNDAVLTPTSFTYGDIIADFSASRPLGKIVAANALNQVKAVSTADEQARWDANGYNAMCKIQCVKDANTTYGAQGYWEAVDGMTLCTVTFKVNDGVAPGTAVNFDMLSGLFGKNHIYLQAIDTANNNRGTNKYGAQYYDSSSASFFYTLPEEAAVPALTRSSADYKMTLTSKTTVADAWQFRVTSSITDADWDAYFANTGAEAATNNCITELGFVAYKGTTGFDMDAAKALAAKAADVQQEGDYFKATTTYVQKENADSVALFGARIELTSAETRSDVTYIAYVKYLDNAGNEQLVTYDASYQALLNQNYSTFVQNYINHFGPSFEG